MSLVDRLASLNDWCFHAVSQASETECKETDWVSLQEDGRGEADLFVLSHEEYTRGCPEEAYVPLPTLRAAVAEAARLHAART